MLLAILYTSSSYSLVAPAFRAQGLDGQTHSLQESLKPDRHLLVCFWATWCEPCLQELKMVTSQLSQESSLPVDILAINVDSPETQNQIRPTLQLYRFKFPVVTDPKHEIFQKYNSSETLPFSALVNARGEIVSQFSGFSDEMFSKISSIIKGRVDGAKK